MKTQLRILVLISILLNSYPGFSQPKKENPVVHIVLFQFKDGTTPQQIDNLFAAVDSLKNTIPGIIQISHGKDFSNRSKAFTHGEVIRFTGKKALDDFYTHPAHAQLIRDFIKPVLADILVMDWEESEK